MYKSLIKANRKDEAYEFFFHNQQKYKKTGNAIVCLAVVGYLIIHAALMDSKPWYVGAVIVSYFLGYKYCKNLWDKEKDASDFNKTLNEHNEKPE